ncbi:MAG: Outer membrane protein Imp, required for envelope biogenesis / Organic solvent tolerance protein precursor [uncultured Thiotrichaceae bacterium]|uniref:LPS-assembly protein LptD n=1 Tax=uncultured Thiotrichaceae bacterium TaxID=298394 RepID=A0A6S6TTB0_9GAMM|nr:MAG: Outer membrane protein Imp, required for envelope biogenesis / Organic solvent tolerance protein precursor [uncultured Thiotrichaceae bacterium]
MQIIKITAVRFCYSTHWRLYSNTHLNHSKQTFFTFLATSVLCINPALAEGQWSNSCAVNTNTIVPGIANPTPGAIYLEADEGKISQTGTSVLKGNITIQQNQTFLSAGEATFNRKTQTVDAKNNITLQTPTLQINSQSLELQLSTDKAIILDTSYQLKNGDGNGASKRITQDAKEKTTLEDATFSTCPANQKSWHIKAEDITLDHTKQIGTARNVSLRVGNTPIFYSPYFDFPLNNQRKSGFLVPRIGITAQSGTSISLPYYFNLASNYDLTLTPNILTQRGLKVDSEFRYLDKRNEGVYRLDMLPSDNNYDDKDRVLTSIKHHAKLAHNTELTIDATNVSDDDYFDDLGDSLLNSSTVSLERTLKISRTQDDWTFATALQDYQILDSSSPPYSRLPELSFRYAPEKGFYNTQNRFETELVNFHSTDAVTGLRLDINALSSKRFGDASWYVEPSLELRHTMYSLDNNTTSDNDSPSRTLPTASIDAGVFFERNIPEKDVIQTLEPRLLYTYTPYKDQSDIPVFDSAATSFGTSTQLFAKNRFTGKDRIGDTNQLTTALTSRLIDTKDGREKLTASIGQIFYFDDRRVTLPGFATDTTSSSELALELSSEIGKRTRFISSTYWDTDTKEVSLNETRLHYKDPKDRVVNLVYRNLDEEFEQAQLSFSTPVNDEWALIGNYERDLKNDRNLEVLAGIEYSSCCWKTRIVGRRYLTSDNITYDNATFIEFELKGLGNIGTGAESFLKEQIYGYED